MFKRFLILLIFLLSLSFPPLLYPQNIHLKAGTALNWGTSLPSKCNSGDVYIDTDADTDGQLYICKSTGNDWKAVGSSGSDMTKAVYDSNSNNHVDDAENLYGDPAITGHMTQVYMSGAPQSADPGDAQVGDKITCKIDSWNPGGLSGTDNYRIRVTEITAGAITGFVVLDDDAGRTYSSDLHLASVSILDPDAAEAVSDTVTILPVEAERFPNGITIHDAGIKIDDNNLAYVVTVEEWSDPGTHAYDLETITASTGDSTYEYEDDGTIGNGSGGSAGDCNAGSIIKADLPTTDGVGELTVWITYSVNP